MTTLTDFLLARVAEDERMWQLARDAGASLVVRNAKTPAAYLPPAFASRLLAECEAKRRIVEQHRSWPVLVESPPKFEEPDAAGLIDINNMTFRMSQQIAWTTEQQYRETFGSEPPTAPMIRTMASVYADHPDYDEAWRL